jgi:hypothetical protein
LAREVSASVAEGTPRPMIWLYAVLAIIIAVAIWLAIVVIKWLLILAVAAALIWVLFALRRRLA